MDLSVLEAFFQKMGEVSPAEWMSIIALPESMRQWFVQKRRAGEQVTIEAYAAHLQEQNHEQLAYLVIDNKLTFENLLSTLEASVSEEVRKLDAGNERRHQEATNLDVVADHMRLTLESRVTGSLEPTRRGDSVETQLECMVGVNNRNNSEIAIESGNAWFQVGHERVRANLDLKLLPGVINPGGAANVRFQSREMFTWSKEENVSCSSVSLKVRQSDSPLCFDCVDGKFVSRQPDQQET